MNTIDNILNQMKESEFFIKYVDYLPYVMKHVNNDGSFHEFGTYQGNTARLILPYLSKKSKFHLYDTWTGLPEKWEGRPEDSRFDKGAFDCKGEMPYFRDKRVVFHKGLFSETIPDHLAIEQINPSLIHIDCDLYQSTKDIFTLLGHTIKTGTVIMFDEFYNYEGFEKHEIKAFSEWVEENDIKYEFIAHTRKYHATVRITD